MVEILGDSHPHPLPDLTMGGYKCRYCVLLVWGMGCDSSSAISESFEIPTGEKRQPR